MKTGRPKKENAARFSAQVVGMVTPKTKEKLLAIAKRRKPAVSAGFILREAIEKYLSEAK